MLKRYLTSNIIPTSIFLVYFLLLILSGSMGITFSLETGNMLLAVLAILVVGILVSGIYQIIKKMYLKGSISILMFLIVLISLICFQLYGWHNVQRSLSEEVNIQEDIHK